MTDPIGGITRREFIEGVQQKHVVKEIMKNPGEFSEKFHPGELPAPPSVVASESDYVEQKENGGVHLIDKQEHGQEAGYQAMVPEVDLMNPNPGPIVLQPESRCNTETWPRLPGLPPPSNISILESMRSMSISSPSPSMSASEMSASEYASTITSRRGGLKIVSETDPSSPIPPASEVDFSDAASDVTTTAASLQKKITAWNSGNAGQHLFKDAKLTPAPEDWIAWKEREEQAQGKNMLQARFWDKTSSDYRVPECFNPDERKYECPMPGCGVAYEEISDLEGHLLNGHVKRNWRCPLCLKIFQTAHALISHSEAGGKCKVKETSYYDQMLDEISGGFLQAEQLRQPKVYNTAALVANGGSAADGVMGTKFEALMPGE